MAIENLFLNTLTFEYPSEPVKFYFSETNDNEHRSTRLASPTLIPTEVKKSKHFVDLFAGVGGFQSLYTSFDREMKGFKEVEIDFNKPENENIVKRYFNYRLGKYFMFYDNVVVTDDNITKDIQVWILSTETPTKVVYNGKYYDILQMDRFTLRVKYDSFNKRPYLLVANDRPAKLLNVPLSTLLSDDSSTPFDDNHTFTPRLINKVMTRQVKKNAEGNDYVVRVIDSYQYLQKNNKYCPLESTRPIMNREMKAFFGLDKVIEERSFDSKYIRYYEKIEWFRKNYLNTKDIEKIFPKLAYEFTSVEPLQKGKVSSNKRMLVFGYDQYGNVVKNVRQQVGINNGPRIKCPYTDVQLISIYPQRHIQEARNLIQYFHDGNYAKFSKKLSHYTGTIINYAKKEFHIEFENESDPVPEIETALERACYQNRDQKVKYIGIYISPIHKYASSKESKECYYKIKELFLKQGIPTQCVDLDKMNFAINNDIQKDKAYFTYSIQNMAVAICAKLGGAPWLLDEVEQKELVIGIGAFKSDNEQYIGAAFSFDNTGIFNNYNYFQKNELDELVGAIQMAIISYAAINNRPERLIIHYYKKISRKREFQKIEEMLVNLKLDIPVYIVTINKTESEDIVLFDKKSKYNSREGSSQITKVGYMPYSGTWVNLGATKNSHYYLLCNNTRYENGEFSVMDGFPFPVKLNIVCPNRDGEIETQVIQQLIDQVYQFSRIYWKSVKQQGLPVTIKYPEMIAEIMPHFQNSTIYMDNNSLWFL